MWICLNLTPPNASRRLEATFQGCAGAAGAGSDLRRGSVGAVCKIPHKFALEATGNSCTKEFSVDKSRLSAKSVSCKSLSLASGLFISSSDFKTAAKIYAILLPGLSRK